MNTCLNFDPSRITSLTSASKTRIRLPYQWHTDDEQWEITHSVLEAGLDFKEVADIAIYAMIAPSKRKIRTGFEIVITDTHGKIHTKRIAAHADDEEVCKILKAFFAANAPGLDIDYHICFGHYFDQYLKEGDRQRSTIALDILQNGGTVEDVISTLLPYRGKPRVI